MKLNKTILIAALLVPSIGSAEYNAHKLAEAVGSYLPIVASIEYLQTSKCSYLFNTKYSLDQATRDALLHFRDTDREELKTLIEERNLKMVSEARNMVDGVLAAAQKDGIDLKSSCGLVSGVFSNIFMKVRDDYERAITYHGK